MSRCDSKVPLRRVLMAFERRTQDERLRIVVVTRPVRLARRADWGDTRIADDAPQAWRDVLGESRWPAMPALSELLGRCGVAALATDTPR